MTTFKNSLVALMFTLFTGAYAMAGPVQPFGAGSLAEIQQRHDGKPFVLLFWSVDCASCIKEMDGLATTLAGHPELRLVMVATDDIGDSDQVDAVLKKHHLDNVESWAFADANAKKLRYGIDPSWFGELPRSYFYDAKHQRKSQSGFLKPEQLEAWLVSLKQ